MSGEKARKYRVLPISVVKFLAPSQQDGRAMWRLAKATRTLDLNSPYAYLMACRHFGRFSVVATEDGSPVGFVVAYRLPSQADTLFVWQIGVDPTHQRHGLGGRMLDTLITRDDPEPIRFLEATVTPSNEPSIHLFRSFASRHHSSITEQVCFPKEMFPDDAHEDEILMRIGPMPSMQEGE